MCCDCVCMSGVARVRDLLLNKDELPIIGVLAIGGSAERLARRDLATADAKGPIGRPLAVALL